MFPNLRALRIEHNRRWILSLGAAELICLTLTRDTGLDSQDMDGLIQLAFNSHPEGQKEAIVMRIAEHLREDFQSSEATTFIDDELADTDAQS